MVSTYEVDARRNAKSEPATEPADGFLWSGDCSEIGRGGGVVAEEGRGGEVSCGRGGGGGARALDEGA